MGARHVARERVTSVVSLVWITVSQNRCRVGIVVPVFNEINRWDSGYWSEIVNRCDCEWLFVDDGSNDGTREEISRFVEVQAKGSPDRIKATFNGQNVGKAESVRRGFNCFLEHGFKTDDQVGFLDADGAFPPQEVERFVDIVQSLHAGHNRIRIDALWSSRVAMAGRKIARNPIRHYIGRAIHTLIGARHRTLPYDTQCGLKFFRVSPELERHIKRKFETRWLFELEIILRHRDSRDQFVIREEALEEWYDVGGSRIRGTEILRIGLETLKVLKH